MSDESKALVKVAPGAVAQRPGMMTRAMGRISEFFGFRRKVPPSETVGTSGTGVFGGFVQSREKSADLIGVQRFHTFHDLLVNTSITAASARYFLALLAATNWRVKPSERSKSKARADEVAEAFDNCITDRSMTVTWRKVVRRGALHRFHGAGVQEWTTYKRKDGWIGFAGIEARPMHTITMFDVDEVGHVLGFTQQSPMTQRMSYLPRGKCVYMVDDALDDSPIGTGLMRHVVETSRVLRRLLQLEGHGYETDLAGTPLIYAPMAYLNELVRTNKMSAEMRDSIINDLKTFGENHIVSPARYAMIDSLCYPQPTGDTLTNQPMFKIETLRAGGQTAKEIGASILRLEHDIARILGTESLLMGATPNGTQALARVKTEVLGATCSSTNDDMADSYDADLVRPWGILNGVEDEDLPTLEPDAIQLRDVEQIAGVIEGLARAGAVLDPEDPAINAVRRAAGLPDAPEISPEIVTALRNQSIGLMADGSTPPAPGQGFGGGDGGEGGDEDELPEPDDGGGGDKDAAGAKDGKGKGKGAKPKA